jgi:dolichyl-phosphate-mannose-protein mannosyltransferase
MQQSQRTSFPMNANGWLYFAFVILTSFFTYFYNYGFPNQVFWDEPYHIAAAQKYLNNVYFMEQHPPLGKLLIALGEKVVHANPRNDQFINTDYATGFPDTFSFTGYRLVPTLLAWLTTPILFFIFLFIAGNPAIAALLSFLYVFDNAMIVHSRGAMVDSPLTFFATAMMLLFLCLLKNKKSNALRFYSLSAAFGAVFALALATKLVGLVLILLGIPVLYRLSNARRTAEFCAVGITFVLWLYSVMQWQPFEPFALFGSGASTLFMNVMTRVLGTYWHVLLSLLILALITVACFRITDKATKRMILYAASALGAFFLVFFSVWQIHFSLGTRIVPELNNNGYYQASSEYKTILSKRLTSSLSSFPVMMRDSLVYVGYYNKGVPRLDLCKPDENGSPFFFWPLGARSINYRWAQAGEGVYRYLFLQVNPVVWLCGLLGVLLSAAMLVVSVFFPLKEKLKHRFLLCTFLGMYVAYMGAISQLGRVMYLYHYFLPLMFSFVLFGLVVVNINSFLGKTITENAKILALTVLGVLIFAAYQFYHPLSYYEPISDAALKLRSVFPLWELNCVKTC